MALADANTTTRFIPELGGNFEDGTEDPGQIP